MKGQELIPHLFRSEFSRITAVLSKRFGLEHLETAEDIASETFLTALETWSYQGVPDNPRAWLYRVAKNKALNLVTRNKSYQQKISARSNDQNGIAEIDLSEQNITDSQLQMLFAICHPVIPPESQIGLALRVLCGFGVDEIATAFLTNKETINKRLFRAREKLREEKVRIEFPGHGEINSRLDTVLTTLYLLFNEGYYSESNDLVLRKDLCLEAMRLVFMLLGNPATDKPHVNALLALMCFHSSRFDARKNIQDELVLYEDQDESLWSQELISKGAYFLNKASHGSELSTYHLEASIGYWHTIKHGSSEKWENVLQLYDQLLAMEYSPVAALNRAFAYSKVYGSEAAIAEAEKLNMAESPYYYALLGELYWEIDGAKSRASFEKALALTRTKPDKLLFEKKLRSFGSAD